MRGGQRSIQRWRIVANHEGAAAHLLVFKKAEKEQGSYRSSGKVVRNVETGSMVDEPFLKARNASYQMGTHLRAELTEGAFQRGLEPEGKGVHRQGTAEAEPQGGH